MFNRYLTYYKNAVQILSFFGLFLLALLLSGGIDMALVPWLTDGLSFEEFAQVVTYQNPAYTQAHRIVQFISQVMLFIVPAFVFAYLAYPKPLQYLKITNKLNPKHLLWAAGIMITAIPMINLLEYINGLVPLTDGMYEIEETAQVITKAFLETDQPAQIFFNVVLFVFAAAIGEELFFRGVFQNILISTSEKKYHISIIVLTAIIFSLFHGEMSGFLPRAYAGFLIGLAYYMSNTIWVPILMHAINNGFALLMFYVSESEFDNPIGTLDYKDLLEIIPLTILSVFLIYYFYKRKTTYTIDDVEIDEDETHFLANYKN